MIKISHISAFTDTHFEGNPAAVCYLENPISASRMQNIASEFNLSETAFITKHKKTIFNIRWFTPKVEVPLCGHATLASAHFLWENKIINENYFVFQSKSGNLKIEKNDGTISMFFPKFTTQISNIKKAGILSALNINLSTSCTVYQSSNNKIILEFESSEVLKSCSPNFDALKSYDVQGIILTAPGKQHDFFSRYFAPNIGINEDPVTGSNHSILAPFWANKLKKTKLKAHQASKRGGDLTCEVLEDAVRISGHAKTFYSGTLYI